MSTIPLLPLLLLPRSFVLVSTARSNEARSSSTATTACQKQLLPRRGGAGVDADLPAEAEARLEASGRAVGGARDAAGAIFFVSSFRFFSDEYHSRENPICEDNSRGKSNGERVDKLLPRAG